MLWADEWVPMGALFAGITQLSPEGLNYPNRDLMVMAITVNAVFKTIQCHKLRAVVFPLLGIGKEQWNLVILLWMISMHLPLCPSLESFRIISRGANGFWEGNQNLVRRFIKHSNNLMKEAQEARDMGKTRSCMQKMEAALCYFNEYRMELTDTMKLKESQEVMELNGGTLSIIQRMIAKAEDDGYTLYNVIYNSSPGHSLYSNEERLVRTITDREIQIWGNAKNRSWTNANSITQRRMYEEQQGIVDSQNDVEPPQADKQEIYAQADMRRTDYDMEIAVEPTRPPFQEPEEGENAIVTLKTKDIRVDKVQLISKTWMYEWLNDSEALGYSKTYEIHPSSIVFSSGKLMMLGP